MQSYVCVLASLEHGGRPFCVAKASALHYRSALTFTTNGKIFIPDGDLISYYMLKNFIP